MCRSARGKGQTFAPFYHSDDADEHERLVKINHEVPAAFPDQVLEEAAALPMSPGPEDLTGREDIRHLPLVTIDGSDARDFDDAIHVEKQGHGWLLRVAIADVSHYVRPVRGKRPSLDAEALTRGNSWYFPRSVEPMLPPLLSNGLCSLKPHEDRLAVLIEIAFDSQGLPGKTRFALAVMRSVARLTYDGVKACLLDRDPRALTSLRAQTYGEAVLTMLKEAFALFSVLREQRRARGSLDFDLPEPCYTFDQQGRVTSVCRAQRHDAHRLIEEFMIAANEAVARFLEASDLPFLYRVHPAPTADRLTDLLESLRATAVDCLTRLPAGALRRNGAMPLTPAGLQAILTSAKGSEHEFLVSRLCLRALSQARYHPDNEGHFGLASQAYCHFTSPIRRYADLLVHRALKTAMGCSAGPVPTGQKLIRLADQLNRRERAAMECEREIARRLACLALHSRLGQRLEGVVSGMMEFGLFVKLRDMPAEGMIRVRDLGNDWFTLDQRSQCLVGQRSGMCWRLGQKIEVLLAGVDLIRLEIRLIPLAGPPERHSPAHSMRRMKQKHKQNGRTASWRKSSPEHAKKCNLPHRHKGKKG